MGATTTRRSLADQAAHRQATNPVRCGCGMPARLAFGDELWPRREDLADVATWVCDPCESRVGVHAGGVEPKGTLADAPLRLARMRAHAAFDPLWREGAGKKNARRRRAYAWLAKTMRLDPADTHIGMFDEAQCATVVAAVASLQRRRTVEGASA